MKDLTVTKPFSQDEHNELLQQAVAVIEAGSVPFSVSTAIDFSL